MTRNTNVIIISFSQRKSVYFFLISLEQSKDAHRVATAAATATLILTSLNSEDGSISGRNFSKVTSSMQRESGLMPVPSNWCSLIEIMSRHPLWPSFRRNIRGIRRSAIYFLHSFGILIFISRFRVVVITHWSRARDGGGIKESGEREYFTRTKCPASFPFWFSRATGLMIMPRYSE